MSKLTKLFRKWMTAFLLGVPTFSRGKDEAAEKVTDPIESVKPSKLQPGGKLEEVNKAYGRTIAGGPGSQKIGDTFDALPPAVKASMIAARKGRIIRTDAAGFDMAGEGPDHAARKAIIGKED